MQIVTSRQCRPRHTLSFHIGSELVRHGAIPVGNFRWDFAPVEHIILLFVVAH